MRQDGDQHARPAVKFALDANGLPQPLRDFSLADFVWGTSFVWVSTNCLYRAASLLLCWFTYVLYCELRYISLSNDLLLSSCRLLYSTDTNTKLWQNGFSENGFSKCIALCGATRGHCFGCVIGGAIKCAKWTELPNQRWQRQFCLDRAAKCWLVRIWFLLIGVFSGVACIPSRLGSSAALSGMTSICSYMHILLL